MLYQRPIERTYTTDVLVVGAGSAGATAAITAAQLGCRVLLVERYGFMGGTSTQVLDTFYGFYTPGTIAHKVVGGVPDQVVNRLMARRRALLRPNTYGAGQGITYDPQALKIVWEELATAAGVQLLYHTFVVDTIMDGAQVTGVVAVNKSGMVRIDARMIIDASGDADVAVRAGAPYEGGDDGSAMQSLTTTFQMINVDDNQARRVSKTQLHALMAAAIAQGYDLPRKEGSVHITPFEGVMVTNMTRVAHVNALDIDALTAAEIEGRRQAERYAQFLVDFVPGYQQAVLNQLSHQIGVRETRRIIGAYQLTRDDVINARDAHDSIARCGAPIEDHHGGIDTEWHYLADGATYAIPFRCLIPHEITGVLVVGRCLSATHDAHASVRSMGQCMAMGQAAGVAAAMAQEHHVAPHQVDVVTLQHTITQLGGIV
ncbi:MAG: FAD-dependent oxidoreductase [Roseiflexaceae bacterium]